MPAGATYEPIATTTVSGSSAADITFSSISGSYTDLVVVMFLRSTRTGTGTTNVYFNFNADTATNYSSTYIYGDGTTAASDRYTSQTVLTEMGEAARDGNAANIFTYSKAHIFNYAGSTNKTVLSEISSDLNGAGYVMRNVGLWRSTAAITSIKITTNAGNIAVGSSVTLYGIKAA